VHNSVVYDDDVYVCVVCVLGLVRQRHERCGDGELAKGREFGPWFGLWVGPGRVVVEGQSRCELPGFATCCPLAVSHLHAVEALLEGNS